MATVVCSNGTGYGNVFGLGPLPQGNATNAHRGIGRQCRVRGLQHLWLGLQSVLHVGGGGGAQGGWASKGQARDKGGGPVDAHWITGNMIALEWFVVRPSRPGTRTTHFV